MDSRLISFVVVACIAMQCAFVIANRRPLGIAADGSLVLHHGLLMKVVAVACTFAIPFALIGVIIVVPFKNASEPFIAAGMMLFFLLCGGYLMLVAFKTQVVVGPTTIAERTILSRRKEIKWSDVVNVRYSSLSTTFTIYDASGTKISAHIWLRGMNEFVEILKEKLPPAKLEKAEPGFKYLESMGKIFGG